MATAHRRAELRTPITVLAGYLSMMDDGSLGRAPDSWAVPLQILKTKTGELNRIMETLVKASQIDANVAPLKGQVIDLCNIVEEAVARARPRADLLHADISTKLAIGALPVNADKEELGRVVDNLINNSLSYSAPPARLFIDVSRDSERALVRVRDDGVGIPEDQARSRLRPFLPGREPRGRQGPGRGARPLHQPSAGGTPQREPCAREQHPRRGNCLHARDPARGLGGSRTS